MGNLTVTCSKAKKFLNAHDFKFMKRISKLEFPDNAIKFKVRVLILRPTVKIEFKSYKDGILYVEVDTSELLEGLFKLIFGTQRTIDEALKKSKWDDVIKRVEGKDLEFEIFVNKLLEEKVKIKGITVTNIQLVSKKLIIDFEV
jgi:hypothetical protein